MTARILAGLGAILITSCGPSSAPQPPRAEPPAPAAAFPASLAPFGEGYPNAGDPCRRLGESPASANFLDDSATLVGCPTPEAAAALGGRVVATIEGITLVSIPAGDANPGRAATDTDALVPGTDYNATAEIPCGVDGAEPAQRCQAGVRRTWGEDGTTLVEVTKPDGRPRAIFFLGNKAYSADGAESDGSAGFSFNTERRGDETVIRFGPETYVIPDAFVLGG
jgi:hypothetical protein